MKAIIHRRYGGPDALDVVEIEEPTVGADQVLVHVRASSVNAYDWHMLRGKPYIARVGEGFRRPKSVSMGVDASGVVEAVGDNVTDLQPGDEVYGARNGAFAEYVAGRSFAAKPAGLGFEQAAAVPTAG
jgi:NADPH:quinone reductase-like Zn-dependent oxidoreductase